MRKYFAISRIARSNNADKRRMHTSGASTKANYHPKPKCTASLRGRRRLQSRMCTPWARYKHNKGRMHTRDTIVKKRPRIIFTLPVARKNRYRKMPEIQVCPVDNHTRSGNVDEIQERYCV